jgi:Asp-tRNA(Asn)/Glu-tRNA(Gln) amidotransferase A subunit family amidase
MPTCYGSPIYQNEPAYGPDATVVAALRGAGALIMGKTHTTEFAATNVGGPCVNPYGTQRTPGGSSSGSAAAVADYQVPLAIGTQTGGSMIRPGAYCGIYALKVCANVFH